MARYSLNTYVLKNNSADDVAEGIITSGRQTDAFFIHDLDDAYNRIQYFKKMMPRVNILYAIKANDNEALLKLCAALGLGFDCATAGEIYKVLKLGVDPRSVIFASPIKLPEWMIYARKSGIKHATFDSSSELKRIKQYWPDARLLIRIRVDGDSVYRLGEKFGCDFETEAINLLEEAATLDIKVVGVAFHVGSVCSSADSHAVGILHARALFDHEAGKGRKMTILDIGGGFLSEKAEDIDEVSQVINRSLEKYFPENDVQIIAEPGRYICDSSMTLYCSINSVKTIKKDNEVLNMIYINDGIYGTLQFSEFFQPVHKFEKKNDKKIKENYEKSILWGYSLDSLDRVMKDVTVMLPPCSAMDWLVFPIRGGYSIVFCSSFGCFQQPYIQPVISEKLWKQIKNSKVFKPGDFIENPDISQPLPSTMPPLVTMDSHVPPNIKLM